MFDASDPAELAGGPPNTGGSLISRVGNTIFVFNQLRSSLIACRNWRRGRTAYTVAVNSTDRFFYDVQRWLIGQLESYAQRSLLLVSREYEEKEVLTRVFDSDSASQLVMVDGHKVWVTMEKPMSGQDMLRAEMTGSSTGPSIDSPRLLFTCYTAEANEALLALLDNLKTEANRKSRRPRLHLLSSWYSSGSAELPDRPLDTVILAEGQVQRIADDLERFLNSEKEYLRRGIPWHRGYLFHGPPGTGKSSIAKALASHFGLDLYYYPIGSCGSDMELTKAVANVEEKSILLLEDVDVFQGFKERDNDKDKFSLSGFLNILDGVMTPHGMITIMTTNHKDQLDPAVLRPGRVDLDEELGVLEGGQADAMFKAFYGHAPNRPLHVSGFAPSVVMEVMKSNLYTPLEAEARILDLRGKKIIAQKRAPIIIPRDDDELESVQ